MISYTKNIILSGASIKGQTHVERKLPNQDSFIIKKKGSGYALSVCDGVGSHKFSKSGSKAACKAVLKTYGLYRKKEIQKEEIGNTIEKYYKKYVKSKFKKQAGTTCLFAFIYLNGEVVIGQAGDGLILLRVDDKFVAFKNKNDEFLNDVSCLDCNKNGTSWKIRNLKVDWSNNKRIQIVLSTDGISEDIKPDKRETFMDYIIEKSKEKHGIFKELEKWNVPGSNDDKTVVVFSWGKE